MDDSKPKATPTMSVTTYFHPDFGWSVQMIVCDIQNEAAARKCESLIIEYFGDSEITKN
jgi:hypothetical protein